jgi:hypothetical protein
MVRDLLGGFLDQKINVDPSIHQPHFADVVFHKYLRG